MRPASLPVWSYPPILVLLGVVLAISPFCPVWRAVLGGVSLLFVGYLALRTRWHPSRRHPASNLLPLFPGHLLLLFAVGRVAPTGGLLTALWAIVPVLTAGHDAMGLRTKDWRGWERSLSAILYCIIWADLFFLLERVVALGRGLSGNSEIALALAFGGVGVVFLALGIYRHVRVSTEFEE